ncbi:hypothetical protein ACHAWO_007205 [Cyclotella atomus]|jgi:DnaJ family protein C protein 17|uniref:J domain-containing protein n=1 Tax=Cyclotella atomus TaxID=382360 RepID=A0ABD3NCW3_9STRA
MPSSVLDKDGMPLKDPYKVLNISTAATDTEIKKAYRQLALKLHPDKQSDSLTDSQRLELDKQFHDVKDARAFLLDAEHADARRKYVANLASERMRHAEEERREMTMSSRRKRMRDELTTREKMAKMASTSHPTADEDRFDVERLRREGERLREEYYRREAEVDADRRRRMAVDNATQKLQKEDRQVRLKWSRKKVVGGIHTVQSLTGIMKDFGQVEEVEMLGSKGNAALITFAQESSCKSCVDAYRTSETMRATFVGRKKHKDNMHEVDDNSVAAGGSQHAETLEEQKLRQAAERERLMRQMELEEDGVDAFSQAQQYPNRSTERQDINGGQPTQKKSSFPPDFPGREKETTAPFELLEKYEKLLFDRIEKLKS